MKGALFFILVIILFVVFLPLSSSSATNDLLLFNINEGYIKDSFDLIKSNQGSISDSLAKFVTVAGDLREYDDYKNIVKNRNFSEYEIKDLSKTFSAVLSGAVGNYEYKTVTRREEEIEVPQFNPNGTPKLDKKGKQIFKKGKAYVDHEDWNTTWGVRCRFPFVKSQSVSYGNDFGNERTYGGLRTHEGNDLFASNGTPIINIESGYLKRIGWSDFGGWNVIIESMDGKRRYYYAHMQNFGSYTQLETKIESGQVIGYVGSSGYGAQGTTGKFEPHLHLQIEVKYDETTDELININPYALLKFLEDYKVELNNPNTDIRVHN